MATDQFELLEGSVTSPHGFTAAGVRCGIKIQGKDVMVLKSDTIASTAAMFTTNKVPAYCITYDRELIRSKQSQAIVINSGNANACSGEQGMDDTIEMARFTAEQLGVDSKDVLVASTGIIGEPLPMDILKTGITDACENLSETGGDSAAEAIMTTDTFPKHHSVQFEIDGKICTIGGMAKGSGMINPNLATMIAVFTTDININPDLLQEALHEAVNVSFNALTIDGEMSTNDCVFLMANGKAKNAPITEKNKDYQEFLNALKFITIELAKIIAEDGEGATKLILVTVKNAISQKEAYKAANFIANSALVKTAIYGKDPNWGRVVQAVGASGVEINPDKFMIKFADVIVAENGTRKPFNERVMWAKQQGKEINIVVDLAVGNESATVFTCDLTHEYITINAEYHT